jgi:hypothetical protein
MRINFIYFFLLLACESKSVFKTKQEQVPNPSPATGSNSNTTSSALIFSNFKVGDQIELTQNTNIRSVGQISPTTLLGVQSTGAIGTIKEGPTQSKDSYGTITWWKVDFQNGISGIAGEDNFKIYLPPTQSQNNTATNNQDTSSATNTVPTNTVPTNTVPTNTTPTITGSGCVSGKTRALSQFGITWYFDKEYTCGTFANGDFWVVGPAQIIRITPDFDGSKNGWEVNPIASDNKIGYTSRGPAAFNSALIPKLPYLARSGESIVKTTDIIDYNCKYNDGPKSPGRISLSGEGTCEKNAFLQSAAVLTIVGAPVPNGTFRPPYSGNWKPLNFNISQLQTQHLKNLAPVANTPTIAKVKRTIERVQLDDVSGWIAGQYNPVDNFSSTYGAGIVRAYAEAILRLHIQGTLEEKLPLLVDAVQVGLDYYGLLKSGRRWIADGGHESGPKLPILFAGKLLNNAEILGVGKSCYPMCFQEDQQFFFSNVNVPFPGPNASTPCYLPMAKKYYGAYPRYGIRHAQTWMDYTQKNGEVIQCGGGPYSSYWGVNIGSQRGAAIAAEISGLRSAWNNDAFFANFERINEEGGVFEVWQSFFNNNMYRTYHYQFK